MQFTLRIGGRHFPTWLRSWAKLLTKEQLWILTLYWIIKITLKTHFRGWALEVGFDARKAYGICSEAMFLILGRPLRYSDTTSSCSFRRSSKVRRCQLATTWSLRLWVAIDVWCLWETNSRKLFLERWVLWLGVNSLYPILSVYHFIQGCKNNTYKGLSKPNPTFPIFQWCTYSQ